MNPIKLVSSIVYHLHLIMANTDKLAYTGIDSLVRILNMVKDICDDSGIERLEDA